jgi:DNA mismatch repair protein MutS
MLKEVVDSGVKLTPMMVQYVAMKREHPDSFMLFRMGDFYELFFDDAKEAAKILNITLTHRGKLGDYSIPMAGIPHHAASTYIDRITNIGKKAAICEQIEDPKEAKGIVKRAVTQVVSPGIPFDLEKTNTENRYIASAYSDGESFYLALLDFTTGNFLGHKLTSEEELIDKLRTFSPKELLSYPKQWEGHKQFALYLQEEAPLITHLSEDYFGLKNNELYIERLIPGYKRDKIIKLVPNILNAISALSYYITSTQSLDEFCHIRPFRMDSEKGKLKVSLSTLKGLEIFPKSREGHKDSLLGFMDKTKNAMGSRALKFLFQTPLGEKSEIIKRQELISFFVESESLLSDVRENLSEMRDLERIMAKVGTKKVTSSDLLNLAKTIVLYQELITTLKNMPKGVIHLLSKEEEGLLSELSESILNTLNDEIGASLDKGNLIQKGASKKRDRLAKISQNAAGEVLKLETQYREKYNISKLKIKHNNINGYFIEITKLHAGKVPKHFIRKQTLVNSERFITEELVEFEKDVISAQDKLEKLERELFESLVSKTAELSQNILTLSLAIGHLDVFQSLAWIAFQEEFTRPTILEDRKLIQVKGGHHPLIKATIRERFVPHDLCLDERNYFGLITGPNMAGKTTVMREMAIIQFLAQLGSFVPAKEASLGLCDYLFSRLGASDDILKGQSTFMVEMSETAEILRHATDKSLILMDEVGRGTSTYDGLSIAWGLVEHFVTQTKALTLFSTHYHELIDLAEGLSGAKNLTVETVCHQGDVRFLYRLIEEGATESFGIYVAKLAGLPRSILHRSSEILKGLEKEELKTPLTSKDTQPSLFDAPRSFEEVLSKEDELRNQLQELDILNMTPIEALQKLQSWQQNMPNQ